MFTNLASRCFQDGVSYELTGEGVALDFFQISASEGIITLTRSLREDQLQLSVYTVKTVDTY